MNAVYQNNEELHMSRKILLGFTCLGAACAVALYLLSISRLRRLPQPGRVSMDGITTIEDAVEARRHVRLQGWDLVAYAQQLVARIFTYSRLNTWEPPALAFERGMGCCEQQALALTKIYDRLEIAVRPVFSLHCKFSPKVVDGMPWPGLEGSRAMPGCESGSPTGNLMCVLARPAIDPVSPILRFSGSRAPGMSGCARSRM